MHNAQLTTPTTTEELLALQIMLDVAHAATNRIAAAAEQFARQQRERADRCHLLAQRLATLEVRP
jgi:hypothetical protein